MNTILITLLTDCDITSFGDTDTSLHGKYTNFFKTS